eukprot:CAMPEP_0174288272 /NCGR_PEP_ID=MMETSP0809-20121228/19879_1 /TAXON_ID=73025 ORGANISM="Eutreptiella gymnastica-like, Strain CCMP1594" /NCGR_SAMPLE_ID=MMETSP0809 /ASSEMBLY_ACC=CAM_ASM_000658 /LENGTH=905 /DNA_ID=CAMNT_0015385349 /DNA_START=41 /DNA_END=2758 /DNA_ORIENTATION=+
MSGPNVLGYRSLDLPYYESSAMQSRSLPAVGLVTGFLAMTGFMLWNVTITSRNPTVSYNSNLMTSMRTAQLGATLGNTARVQRVGVDAPLSKASHSVDAVYATRTMRHPPDAPMMMSSKDETVLASPMSQWERTLFMVGIVVAGVVGVFVGRRSQDRIAMATYMVEPAFAHAKSRPRSRVLQATAQELTHDEKKDVLKEFGLNEKGATDVLKNEELTELLLRMGETFGASKLLYSAVTKAQTDAHRELLGQYIKDEKIATAQQLDCALAFLTETPNVVAGDPTFEKESGVGVIVTDEEIIDAVAKAFEENKAKILEDRYQYNFGFMLGRLLKADHIKWADSAKLKQEVEKQTLAVLGPKTEADEQAGKKKKKKKAKPQAKQPKVKKPSAAELAAEKEAGLLAMMTEAADAATSSFLYNPRLCRITELLDNAAQGVFPDEDQEYVVGGWIRTTRDQRAMTFMEINDGSGPTGLQIVLEPNTCPDLEEFRKLGAGYGACIEATGKVVKSPAAGQLIEMKGTSIKLIGPVADGFPLAKTATSLENLRLYPHLRVRTNVMACVMRVRNEASFAIHKFFKDRHFQYVHTPVLTSNDCEGAGECFTVSTLLGQPNPDYSKDFFGSKAMLTVSGQLNVETYAAGLTNVYTFGPTFRAENSNTSRHLAEFWMVEPEVWFIDQKGLMDLAEDFLRYCIAHVLKECQADILYLSQYHQRMEEERTQEEGQRTLEGTLVERLVGIVSEPFGRVTYTEAIDILKKEAEEGKVTFEDMDLHWGMDMGSEHERYLAEQVFKKPVIVTNYPAEIKSFYMKQSEDGKTVAGMDILVPSIGEIIGGSVREDDFDKLVALAKSKGMSDADIESLSWYTDLRKYGSAPHGGFGLGFERLLLLCTGMLNIRDVIPFPRYPGGISC